MFILMFMLHVIFILLTCKETAGDKTSGYITYCPCMGRFGNQADQFLGAISFSKTLNRTLIIPPWLEFPDSYELGSNSTLVPFDTYFKVDAISKYLDVITMEEFMEKIAPEIWPDPKRVIFCYIKSESPFKPFWDSLRIDFVGSEFYDPLNFDGLDPVMIERWKATYPPSEWPVLAFTGAPGTYPVEKENIFLQKYLQWSEDIETMATAFINKHMNEGGFLGIHLRNGKDFLNACGHLKDFPLLMAAPQCVGYKNEKGPLTMSMCFPQKIEITEQIKRALTRIDNIKYVFVASDSDHMIEELNEALRLFEITAIRLDISNHHLDLAVLGKANHFIGNCVSSFTAFVKRERDIKRLTSEFWSYPPKHDEL